MYKHLSDLDTDGNGRFGIEWDTDCGRFWEWFDSEEARERELTKYRAECDAEDDRLLDVERMDEPSDGFLTDAEADADVLRSAGMGTDEDYGYYGNEC